VDARGEGQGRLEMHHEMFLLLVVTPESEDGLSPGAVPGGPETDPRVALLGAAPISPFLSPAL